MTKVGVYKITYKVWYTNYSTNIIAQTVPFTVTVIDPCDNPVSVTASTLSDQFYTITQNAFEYQFPVYAVSPTWCTITYAYAITNSVGAAAINKFSSTTRTFTFKQLTDLSLSGSSAKDYTITVTGTAGKTTFASDKAFFNLQLKNPCIDPDFVKIQTYPLPTGM